jgi:lipopolysaccharide transport system ATP-binding protein
MSSDIAIKVENLSKCYQIYDQPRDRLKQFILPRLQGMLGHTPRQYFREFWALKDVSFEVKKGETVGIIGRNGSGKSTLLQMICGTLNPSSGSIQTHGRIAALLELGSGFNPEFSGRENVYMNAAVLGLHTDEIDRRFDEIAAFADIGDFIEQPVKTYSSGMTMRLAFAISVCVDPDILVIDEALAVGDAAFQFKCLERMRLLAESGTTLLFVSHDMGMVQSFCKKVIYLDMGCLKNQGGPGEIAERYFFDIRDEQRRSSSGSSVIIKKSISNNSLPAFGTEQGYITYAYFLPSENHKQVFASGEQVSIDIGYEYLQSLDSVSISVYLHDYKMLDVSGRYFLLKPHHINGSKFTGHILVSFFAKLKPGLYFLTIRLESMRAGNSCFPVDKQPAALTFEISNNDTDFLGTVDIGMRIMEL